MIRRSAVRALVTFLFLAAAASTVLAQKTVEDLCRTHGLDGQESIRRMEMAYAAAVTAGISEEELLPFVEDILRHKLDCGQMVRVLAVTARMRGEGLPYFVVISKVREGVAKDAPSALVVEAAEGKYKTLSESRDVIKSFGSMGYSVRDFQNAAIVVSSYIERGYTPDEIVTQVRSKGIQGAGFTALAGVVEKPVKRKPR